MHVETTCSWTAQESSPAVCSTSQALGCSVGEATVLPCSRCHGFRWNPTHKGELHHEDKYCNCGLSLRLTVLLPSGAGTPYMCLCFETIDVYCLHTGAKEGFCLTDKDVSDSPRQHLVAQHLLLPWHALCSLLHHPLLSVFSHDELVHAAGAP